MKISLIWRGLSVRCTVVTVARHLHSNFAVKFRNAVKGIVLGHLRSVNNPDTLKFSAAQRLGFALVPGRPCDESPLLHVCRLLLRHRKRLLQRRICFGGGGQSPRRDLAVDFCRGHGGAIGGEHFFGARAFRRNIRTG